MSLWLSGCGTTWVQLTRETVTRYCGDWYGWGREGVRTDMGYCCCCCEKKWPLLSCPGGEPGIGVGCEEFLDHSHSGVAGGHGLVLRKCYDSSRKKEGEVDVCLGILEFRMRLEKWIIDYHSLIKGKITWINIEQMGNNTKWILSSLKMQIRQRPILIQNINICSFWNPRIAALPWGSNSSNREHN